MKIGEGVEWGAHVCVTLTWIGAEEPVPAATLAAWFDLPQAYLNKRLQALVRARILTSTPGARGGFQLARPPERITLMDIVVANEGADEAFRCTEIRQRGDGVDPSAPEFRTSCAIAASMRAAEMSWRRALAAQTIADMVAAAPAAAAERSRNRYRLMRG